jgi:hypothetical protein
MTLFCIISYVVPMVFLSTTMVRLWHANGTVIEHTEVRNSLPICFLLFQYTNNVLVIYNIKPPILHG